MAHKFNPIIYKSFLPLSALDNQPFDCLKVLIVYDNAYGLSHSPYSIHIKHYFQRLTYDAVWFNT